MKSTLNREEIKILCNCRKDCTCFKVISMEFSPSSSSSSSSSSYSSSVDSTDPNPCVNLALTLTLPSDSSQRETRQDWPPIKSLLRDTLKGRYNRRQSRYLDDSSLFVKVYMEGVPIGRKLDLLTFNGYETLLQSLSQMFNTSILCGDQNQNRNRNRNRKQYVLTYEDKEGDWMMVGDIPWDMFLGTVRRLKITRPNKS